MIIIVKTLNSVNFPNGKSISELNLILSNPSILIELSLIIVLCTYSFIVLKTLITSIKYLSLEPFIFSTLPNKLLTFQYKGTTLFVIYSSLYNMDPI